jgi:hypothetical protein
LSIITKNGISSISLRAVTFGEEVLSSRSGNFSLLEGISIDGFVVFVVPQQLIDHSLVEASSVNGGVVATLSGPHVSAVHW